MKTLKKTIKLNFKGEKSVLVDIKLKKSVGKAERVLLCVVLCGNRREEKEGMARSPRFLYSLRVSWNLALSVAVIDL